MREKTDYLVATYYDPNRLGISAGEVMQDVLNIPYANAGTREIIDVRGMTSNPAINTRWLV